MQSVPPNFLDRFANKRSTFYHYVFLSLYWFSVLYTHLVGPYEIRFIFSQIPFDFFWILFFFFITCLGPYEFFSSPCFIVTKFCVSACLIIWKPAAISLRLQGKLSFPYNCQKMNGQIYVLLC